MTHAQAFNRSQGIAKCLSGCRRCEWLARLSIVAWQAATVVAEVAAPKGNTGTVPRIWLSWVGLRRGWIQVLRPLGVRERVRASPIIFDVSGDCHPRIPHRVSLPLWSSCALFEVGSQMQPANYRCQPWFDVSFSFRSWTQTSTVSSRNHRQPPGISALCKLWETETCHQRLTETGFSASVYPLHNEWF